MNSPAPTSRRRAVAALLVAALVAGGCASLGSGARAPGPGARALDGVPLYESGVTDCGPGSLAAVLAFHGHEVTLAELRRRLPAADNGGVLSLDLVLEARSRGFDAHLVGGDRETIERSLAARRPVVLMLRVLDPPGRKGDLYHYVVVDGSDPARDLLRVHLGDGEAHWLPFARLARRWQAAGHATILVSPPDGEAPSEPPRLRYAVALEEAGRAEEAAAVYVRVLDDHPDSAIAWTDLGNVRRSLGRATAAEAAYRHALAADPGYPEALNNLAWLLHRRGGEADEAERLARRAVAAAGTDRHLALDTLGRILLDRGDCAGAGRALDDALAVAPADDPARGAIALARGRAALDCSDPRSARAHLAAAVSSGSPAAAEEAESILARLANGSAVEADGE